MILLIVESLVVGGVTGFLSGLLGVGGGFILVPLLAILGVPIHTAIGTSLAFVACTSVAGILQHLRQGSADMLIALVIALPATLMAIEGAYFSGLLSPATLSLIFTFLLVGVLLMYTFASSAKEFAPPAEVPAAGLPWYILHRCRTVAGTTYRYNVHLFKAVLSGVATGMLTGFFGVGGGFLLVPIAVLFLRIPLRVTVGTSLAVLVLPACLGTLSHWRLGHVALELWIPMVLTGILGSRLGAHYVAVLSPQLIKRLFLFLLALGAVFMFVKGMRVL